MGDIFNIIIILGFMLLIVVILSIWAKEKG